MPQHAEASTTPDTTLTLSYSSRLGDRPDEYTDLPMSALYRATASAGG
jgi:hypothetical protein